MGHTFSCICVYCIYKDNISRLLCFPYYTQKPFSLPQKKKRKQNTKNKKKKHTKLTTTYNALAFCIYFTIFYVLCTYMYLNT